MAIPANLRRQVITRAANCCEYCGLAQTGQEATFHIDHVVPVVAGGQSTSENLALACVSCWANPFRATGITNFLENDGTLEAAQRIAGHADSRTTKLYDRRGQKVLLEDMERIRY